MRWPGFAVALFVLAGAAEVKANVAGQVGEVVIMEGDSGIVTGNAEDNYRVSCRYWDPDAPDQMAEIATRLIAEYGDQFDQIAVFTNFNDTFHGGAYYIEAIAETRGIGRYPIDLAETFGSPSETLQGMINMNSLPQSPFGLSLDPDAFLYTVMAQELSHRWLAAMLFTDDSGLSSQDLLGRGNLHWSSLMDNSSSVQDGVDWRDNGDGTFTVVSTFQPTGTYADIDQYGMGLIDSSEIEPFFVIRNATFLDGSPVDPQQVWAGLLPGDTVRGTRVDVTGEQIVSANGPRVPAVGAAPRDLRVAYVLVTRPGEAGSSTQVIQAAETLDEIRVVFDQWWFDNTAGRGRLCSQVSAPCDRPDIRVEVAFDEQPVPGGAFEATARVWNAGAGASDELTVYVGSLSGGLEIEVVELTSVTLAPDEERSFSISGTVADETACGAEVGLRVGAGDVSAYARAPARPYAPAESALADPTTWTVDPDGTDTATAGAWEYGVSEQSFFQPAGGANGPDDSAWATALGVTTPDPQGLITVDVDGGHTTLQSPAVDVAGIVAPVLRFRYFVNTVELGGGGNWPAITTDTLSVQVSTDGDEWTEVAAFNGASQQFLTSEIPLAEHVGSSETITVRFVTSDNDGDSTVETIVDDVEIAETECITVATDTGGCGCRTGGTGGRGAPLALLIGVALYTLRRSRSITAKRTR